MSPGAIYFSKNLASLHLDLMNVLVNTVRPEPAGQTFISNCSRWIDAVHQKPRPLLNIFTVLDLSNETEPETKTKTPFGERLEGFGSIAHTAGALEIAPDFNVRATDIVLPKTRWSATSGSSLVNILRASDVDSVIIVSAIV
jgi:nicotinamidase-related amidase